MVQTIQAEIDKRRLPYPINVMALGVEPVIYCVTEPCNAKAAEKEFNAALATVRGRQATKPTWSDFDILMVAHSRLGEARRLYRDQYGMLPDDKRIDLEIEEWFARADSAEPPKPRVELPYHVVLALMLREGFAGRGRGNKGRGPVIGRVVLQARKRKEDLRRKMPAGKAEKQAAEEAIEQLKRRGYRWLTVSRFRRLMQSDD